MTQRNKAIALALAGAGFVSALTIAYPVWAQTGEDPIPVAVTTRPDRRKNSRHSMRCWPDRKETPNP